MSTGRRDGRTSTAYRTMRVKGLPCTWCGGPATTRDHEPALCLHAHVEGSGCCVVVPACGTCNATRGRLAQRALAEARRRAREGRAAVRVGVLADRLDGLSVL